MGDDIHSIVLHVGPNPGNITRKSDLDIGFFQGKLLLIQEALCEVLRNYGSTAEVIGPVGLDGLSSCGREKSSTTNQIRLGILTNTHVWGNDRGCTIIRQGSGCSC